MREVCKAVEEGFVKGKRRRFFLICNLQNYVGEQKFSYNTSYTIWCISTLCTFIIPLTYKTGKKEQEAPEGFKLKMNLVLVCSSIHFANTVVFWF